MQILFCMQLLELVQTIMCLNSFGLSLSLSLSLSPILWFVYYWRLPTAIALLQKFSEGIEFLETTA